MAIHGNEDRISQWSSSMYAVTGWADEENISKTEAITVDLSDEYKFKYENRFRLFRDIVVIFPLKNTFWHIINCKNKGS